MAWQIIKAAMGTLKNLVLDGYNNGALPGNATNKKKEAVYENRAIYGYLRGEISRDLGLAHTCLLFLDS